MLNQETYAKTPKQVIRAMIWLYKNRLEWTKDAAFRNRVGVSCIMWDTDLYSADLTGCLYLVLAKPGVKSKVTVIINRALGQPDTCNWILDRELLTRTGAIDLLRKAYKNA